MFHFYIGTQCDGDGEGIFHGALDAETGALSLKGLAAEVRRPTWLEIDRLRGRLFAASEIGNKGECCGEVLSFDIEQPAGSLRLTSKQPASGGGSTHLCLSSGGDMIFSANFGGGQASRFAIQPDGQLLPSTSSLPHQGSGPHRRQDKPHPHGVTLSPDERFLLVPDMGNDQIVVHRLDTDGFSREDPSICRFPEGTGPRLVLFDPRGIKAFLLSELTAEIFVLNWDGVSGKLEIIGKHPLDQPEAEGVPSAAAFAMSADGRSLYASNRRSGTICVFSIDGTTGQLSLVQSTDCGGEKPWGLGLSPDEHWLLVANQATDNIVTFRRSADSGKLARVEGEPIIVPCPTDVAFAP